jgi:hypothetical protein
MGNFNPSKGEVLQGEQSTIQENAAIAYEAAAPERARVAAIQQTIEGQIANRRKRPGIASTILTNAIPQANGVPTINPGYVASLLSADVSNNTLLTGKTNVR